MLIKAGFTILQLEGKLDKKVECIIMSLVIIIITILHLHTCTIVYIPV